MPYTLPVFNLAINIWHQPNTPLIGPPDLVTTCNLTPGRRVTQDLTNPAFRVFLLLPKLTDIRSREQQPAQPDIVEVPVASGRYYIVEWVDDSGKGFANEHRIAIVFHNVNAALANPWPVPYP